MGCLGLVFYATKKLQHQRLQTDGHGSAGGALHSPLSDCFASSLILCAFTTQRGDRCRLRCWRGIDFHSTNILQRETDTGVLGRNPQRVSQVAAESASVPHQQPAAITGGSFFTFTDEELIVFIPALKQSVRLERPALPEMLQEGRSTQTLERLESGGFLLRRHSDIPDRSRSYLTKLLLIKQDSFFFFFFRTSQTLQSYSENTPEPKPTWAAACTPVQT